MPTRISAGVGDHPYFLTFIIMIPIKCKITNSSLVICLKFYVHTVLKERSPQLFLARAQQIISGKFVSQYALYLLIFSPLRSNIN